jgi:hypothetical protein
MKRVFWLLAFCGATIFCAAPLPAQDSFYVIGGRPMAGTRITSLPYTISAPGYYYLIRNLTYTDGDGITINADNVTLDLMGFTLTGSKIIIDFEDSKGIYIHRRNNVEIRNGTLTGWLRGIHGNVGNNYRIINIRAVGNDYGIYLVGNNHLIQGCTAYPGQFGINIGLGIIGTGTIRGCTVGNFYNGILISGGTVSDNVVSDCTGNGIYPKACAVISHNQVNNCHVGIDGYYGGSIIGNIVSAASGQTGIVPSTSASQPNILDQNTVSGAGTHYGPGRNNTIWGANAGR